jgi:hypothetical protein
MRDSSARVAVLERELAEFEELLGYAERLVGQFARTRGQFEAVVREARALRNRTTARRRPQR